MTNSAETIGDRNRTCQVRFSHPKAPRAVCDRVAQADGLCIFHTDRPVESFKDFLLAELSGSHWLEKANIKCDLTGSLLSNVNLPCSNFEGRRLERVTFKNALLDEANFRDTVLKSVSFQNSSLRRANFEFADFLSDPDSPIDFTFAELGGIILSSNIGISKLEGATFSYPTVVSALASEAVHEFVVGRWQAAGAIYTVIAQRAQADWDFDAFDRATYFAMTCQHLLFIDARPRIGKGWWKNWILPSAKSGIGGISWLLHRLAWGYGLRPFRSLSIMLVVIIGVGAVLFPVLGMRGVSDSGDQAAEAVVSHSVVAGLLLSLGAFTGVVFGSAVPATRLGEFVAVLEGLVGMILLSLFLVALGARYLRRI
ncbi:MAG: pentapeptide repeat-containing protein [Gemmatimonadota bacterium]|nr:pentapeptide repeat-containing protein [Gemmatimonadota bacterium]